MIYNHIKDCWAAIEEAKTKQEVENLFDQFPRWSGDWEITVYEDHYVVYNTYFDRLYDSFDTDFRDLDIPLEDEDIEDDRSELPWDYSKHFE